MNKRSPSISFKQQASSRRLHHDDGRSDDAPKVWMCGATATGPGGGPRISELIPPSPHSLFTLTELVMSARIWSSPHPPPHYLHLMGPLLLSSCIYIFILPRLGGLPFLISSVKHDYYLLMLITGAFFLSSPPVHFSCVAPRGRNIFISPCAPSFKTFTPAV